MKTTFKAHPLMIFTFLKPFLFVLIIPLIQGGLEYLFFGRIGGILRVEAILFVIISILAYLTYDAFKITLDNDRLIISQGIFIKSKAVINLSKISSVSARQTPIDIIFRGVRVAVNTESGLTKRSDFNFILRQKDLGPLNKFLKIPNHSKGYGFSPLKIAVMSAAKSSAITGIIVGVPIINRIGKLIGVGLNEMLLDRINTASTRLNTYFPPAVNVVSLVLGFFYFVSFLTVFLKNINFRLSFKKGYFKIKRGIITKKEISFKKSAINNLCIEQTPIMRFFRMYSLSVSVGGYGDNGGEKPVILPCGSRREVERELNKRFPEYIETAPFLRANRGWRSFRRFIWLPILFEGITLASGIVLWRFFPYFDRLIVFFTLLFSAVIAYFAFISYSNYEKGEISFGEHITAKGSKGLTFRELYCHRDNLGLITLFETPADRRYRTCKIRLTVRSESADRVMVRNIDKEATLEKINA